jgi:uncharacterized protein
MLDEFDTEIVIEGLEVKKPVILTSFPGIGLVGTIATAHFIAEFKLETIGIVESKMIPPIATLMEGVVLPPVRVYQSADHSLVLIHSDVPVIPEVAHEMGQRIVEWARDIEARRIYSMAGVATFEGKHRVFGAATTKELLEEIKSYVEIFKTISGIAGSILNECVVKKFPGLALLGETLGFNPDPRAAAQVITALNNIFGWGVDVEKLIKEAEFIEAKMQKLAEQTRMHEEGIKKEEFPMYG